MEDNHKESFKIHSPEFNHLNRGIDRRNFLTKTSLGLGALALGSLMGNNLFGKLPGKEVGKSPAPTLEDEILRAIPHFAPKAKRVVYLFMAGGPSQFETFDYKPKLSTMFGQPLPESVRQGQRLTSMSANQSILPIAPSAFKFNQFGESRTWISELLPHTAQVTDDLCIIKSIYSEAINHDPAITFFQTGTQLPGRPSIGSWISYGLGSDNKNLPAFIVLVSKNAVKDQPLYSRLWGNGFLPSEHQGVQFRSGKDAVLFLDNPEGYDGKDRKEMLVFSNVIRLTKFSVPKISSMRLRTRWTFSSEIWTKTEPDSLNNSRAKSRRSRR